MRTVQVYFSTMRRRSKKSTYGCLLWKEESVWTAHNPELGCWGVGKDRRSAIADLAAAVRLMINYLRDIGEAPPSPRAVELGALEI